MTAGTRRGAARPPGRSISALTVASHGWVHLEPWRWDAATGTLSRAERIGGRSRRRSPCASTTRRRSPSPGTGLPRSARAKSCAGRRAGSRPTGTRRRRSPRSAPAFADEAALIARGGGRLLRCSTFYEDFIKTVLTVNTSWSGTCRMTAALVAEPGGGAFPLAGDADRLRRGAAARHRQAWAFARRP